MFGPKIPVVAATVGFALSFVTGLFSGAVFPVFLFRAVLMALLFAALAAIVSMLIRRFLPELLESTPESTGTGTMNETGSVVDLTVGGMDEDTLMPFGSGVSGSDESSQMTPATGTEQGVPDEVDSYGDEGFETAVEEAPSKPAASIASGVPTAEETASGTDTVPKDELHQVKQKPKGAAPGLDVLPDLQDFIPEEKPGSEEEDDDELSVEPVSHGFSVPDVTSDGVETETMAKAIRTILSKDN